VAALAAAVVGSAVSDGDDDTTVVGFAEGLTRGIALAPGEAVGDATMVRQLVATRDASRNRLNQPARRIPATIGDLQTASRDVAPPYHRRAAPGQYPDSE
jgi:hypothetical protein